MRGNFQELAVGTEVESKTSGILTYYLQIQAGLLVDIIFFKKALVLPII